MGWVSGRPQASRYREVFYARRLGTEHRGGEVGQCPTLTTRNGTHVVGEGPAFHIDDSERNMELRQAIEDADPGRLGTPQRPFLVGDHFW
jgi:hypothetical protein